ncbi:HU family DNA-binding protein [Aestuariicoccus sp. MJ-SS9]|nr:HU family DNA-binding protein [Aestuariicoccus sp. MJ-SS9]
MQVKSRLDSCRGSVIFPSELSKSDTKTWENPHKNEQGRPMTTAKPKSTRSTRSTSTRKTTTARKAAAAPETADKSAPEAAAETAGQGTVTVPSSPEPAMRKKELVEQAVARSGVKKRDAKPAIEAALAILGEALADGRELNVAPFGKMKVTRLKKGVNGQVINARVRQPEDKGSKPTEPLAQAAE